MARHDQVGRRRGFGRMTRVNALLRELVAETLERLSDLDDRLVLLTVTEVVCDPDLRHARVFFSSLPPAAAEALEEQRKTLQSAIASTARMKRVPVLSFSADPAIAAAERVEAAIRRVHHLESADQARDE